MSKKNSSFYRKVHQEVERCISLINNENYLIDNELSANGSGSTGNQSTRSHNNNHDYSLVDHAVESSSCVPCEILNENQPFIHESSLEDTVEECQDIDVNLSESQASSAEFKFKLKCLALKHRISHSALTDLLKLLKTCNFVPKDLPSDPSRALAEETFRRQVLRQLSTINYKLDQLAEDVARLSMNERNNNLEIIEDSIFEKYDLPLKNSEELQKIEKYLETTENRINMVCELSKLGGSNHKVMTKRLLEKLLMNSLAMNYSWLGFKKKENFSALNLSKVVIESVMKIHKKVTEADVELAIKGWLVKAKEREEKSLK